MTNPNEEWEPRKDITVEQLSHEEADDLIKNLTGEPLGNVQEAFHDEWRDGLQQRGALPPSERIYYRASLPGSPYLLAGVTPTLPSKPDTVGFIFARICPKSFRVAPDCVIAILESKVHQYCLQNSKQFVMGRLNAGSYQVMQVVVAHLPAGFMEEQLSSTNCILEILP